MLRQRVRLHPLYGPRLRSDAQARAPFAAVPRRPATACYARRWKCSTPCLVMPKPDSDLPPVADPNAPRASFLRVFAAVFSSFLGIRKKAAGERDAVSIKPLHVILAGLLGAAILVVALLVLVRLITHPG